MLKTNRTKYNVDKNKESRTYNNITFESILEMKYYRDVILPGVKQGTIQKYELQKPYTLQDKFTYNGKTILPVKYKADFVVVYSDGREEVIDIKGMPDAVAKLKRKLFWYTFPDIDYKWISHSQKYGGWIEYDELDKLRKKAKKNKLYTVEQVAGANWRDGLDITEDEWE